MTEQKLLNKLLGIFEGLTGYVGQISSDHAYVHKGFAKTAIVDTGTISTAYNIAFTTPSVESGKYVHWRPTGITTSADYVDFNLYEGDSFSGGTAVTPINRNRPMSAVGSEMQAFVKGATSSPAGTIIQASGIGTSGNPAARSGGGAGADQELILKANTDYVLQIVPAGATQVKATLFWYEEDGYTPE